MSTPHPPHESPGGPRRVRAILHGLTAFRDDVRAAIESVRTDGHEVEVRVTWESGDAQRLSREAVRDAVGTLIASGGDGTLNAVMQELAIARAAGASVPSLALVPVGTANDFARGVGLPLEPLPALQFALTSAPTLVDVVQVNERYFINVATGGYGAQVTVATPDGIKKMLGGVAYFFSALVTATKLEPVPASLRGPDFEWDGEFLVLAIGNGRQVGGGHVLCPDALLDDGQLDLRIVPHVPDASHAALLGEYALGGIEGIEQRVIAGRMRWLEVTTQKETQINLDGEPMAGSHFRFDVRPRHLQMHLPPESPVLREGLRVEVSVDDAPPLSSRS